MKFLKFIIAPFTFLWEVKNYVLAALVAGYVGYFIGHWAAGIEAANKVDTKTISTDIKIEEKQDEIRNHRPDRNGVIKRLRGGTF